MFGLLFPLPLDSIFLGQYDSLMDPLHLTIALGPLAIYLLLLGLINLAPFPFVSSGSRELTALAIAISGLIVVGPMELFIPEMAFVSMGPYVWVLMIGNYCLGVLLLVLAARPRLVIYNTTGEMVYEVMKKVVDQIDPDARWAGNALNSPKLGVQLSIETFAYMRNVQLISSRSRQNRHGWRMLEAELSKALRSVKVDPNPWAWSLIGFSVMIVAVIAVQMFRHGGDVANTLHEMLRL